jgi:transposase
MVLARGSRLMDLPGVGPVVAARTLADVADVARFADRNPFASWTGTAPIVASSEEIVRHRLSRAGNRRMNHMIHIAATTQIRLDTEGRAYYRRKLAAGKSRAEAKRCLIGELSMVRPGEVPGRGSSVVSGDGLVAAPRGRPVLVLPPLARRGPCDRR